MPTLPIISASWQWVAGSGADAAPYFRIFNPILQEEKFNPEGSYIFRFIPELNKLPMIDFFNRMAVIMPQPLYMDTNQRPLPS